MKLLFHRFVFKVLINTKIRCHYKTLTWAYCMMIKRTLITKMKINKSLTSRELLPKNQLVSFILLSLHVAIFSPIFFYNFSYEKNFMPSDTGYFQSTLNQPSPACSLQHSDNDDLYQQIMQEVMLNAPSLVAPDSEYALRKEDSLDVTTIDSFMPNRAHRRSYMLAIRRESSRGSKEQL